MTNIWVDGVKSCSIAGCLPKINLKISIETCSSSAERKQEGVFVFLRDGKFLDQNSRKCTVKIHKLSRFAGNNRQWNKGPIFQTSVHTALPQSVHHVSRRCGQDAQRSVRISWWCGRFQNHQWDLRRTGEVQTERHPDILNSSVGSDCQKGLSVQRAHQAAVS